LGYGHKVTAVYEVERKAGAVRNDPNEVLATVRLRYKPFDEENSIERSDSVILSNEQEQNDLLNLVISLGLYLRNSPYKGAADQRSIARLANTIEPRNDEEKELKKIAMNL